MNVAITKIGLTGNCIGGCGWTGCEMMGCGATIGAGVIQGAWGQGCGGGGVIIWLLRRG